MNKNSGLRKEIICSILHAPNIMRSRSLEVRALLSKCKSMGQRLLAMLRRAFSHNCSCAPSNKFLASLNEKPFSSGVIFTSGTINLHEFYIHDIIFLSKK